MSNSHPSTVSHSVSNDARANYAAPTLSLLFVEATAVLKSGTGNENGYAQTSA